MAFNCPTRINQDDFYEIPDIEGYATITLLVSLENWEPGTVRVFRIANLCSDFKKEAVDICLPRQDPIYLRRSLFAKRR